MTDWHAVKITLQTNRQIDINHEYNFLPTFFPHLSVFFPNWLFKIKKGIFPTVLSSVAFYSTILFAVPYLIFRSLILQFVFFFFFFFFFFFLIQRPTNQPTYQRSHTKKQQQFNYKNALPSLSHPTPCILLHVPETRVIFFYCRDASGNDYRKKKKKTPIHNGGTKILKVKKKKKKEIAEIRTKPFTPNTHVRLNSYMRTRTHTSRKYYLYKVSTHVHTGHPYRNDTYRKISDDSLINANVDLKQFSSKQIIIIIPCELVIFQWSPSDNKSP